MRIIGAITGLVTILMARLLYYYTHGRDRHDSCAAGISACLDAGMAPAYHGQLDGRGCQCPRARPSR